MTPHPKEEDREWEKEFDDKVGGLLVKHVELKEGYTTYQEIKLFTRNLLTRTRADERKRIWDIIGKHNARILNEFQLQGKPDLPMVAYDERVCLIPAIEIATKKTFDELSDLISTLTDEQ